jgi:hypothetical protein
MEVRSQPLERVIIEQQLGVIYELCLEFDPRELDVSYGWACHLDIDKLWKDQRIPTTGLSSFVSRSTSEGIVQVGGSDLHINGVHAAFTFTLCHEADIHFESPVLSLVSRVTAAWSEHGLRYYEVHRGAQERDEGDGGQDREAGPTERKITRG